MNTFPEVMTLQILAKRMGEDKGAADRGKTPRRRVLLLCIYSIEPGEHKLACDSDPKAAKLAV